MIKISNISKKFGKYTVLNNIDFELLQGECVALVAPNGAGKTTLMSIMAGILEADTGHILIDDTNNKSNDFYYKVGFMQDNSVLYPYLTGYDHLSFISIAQKLPSTAVLDVAKKVGITSFIDKRVSDYSLGMKQQLLFAMSIIHNPKLLLLDEPFNGLDPLNLIKIRELIIQLNKTDKTTIVLSSHNLDEVDRLSKKIFFLKDKNIIEKNLDNYEKKYYCISSVEPIYHLKTLLNGEWLSDKKLMVSIKDLNNTLSTLLSDNKSISDVESINNGSQFLFNEIYN